VRQLLDPVLLSELLVSFLVLIQLDSLHFGILSFSFHLLDLLLAGFLYFLDSSLMTAVVDTVTSPRTPALEDGFLGNLLAKVFLDFLFLFFFEEFFFFFGLGHEERLEDSFLILSSIFLNNSALFSVVILQIFRCVEFDNNTSFL
jgi:hypothetical protein